MRLVTKWKDVPFNKIIELYDDVGWTAYTKDIQSLKKAFDHSTYVVLAFEGEKIVGLARSISDFVSIHYLQDIIVASESQGNGVGRALLENVLERFKSVRTHMLLTDDDEKQLNFYQSLGYKNTKNLKKIPLNSFVKMKGVDLE